VEVGATSRLAVLAPLDDVVVGAQELVLLFERAVVVGGDDRLVVLPARGVFPFGSVLSQEVPIAVAVVELEDAEVVFSAHAALIAHVPETITSGGSHRGARYPKFAEWEIWGRVSSSAAGS
jgi:hypothetical protein